MNHENKTLSGKRMNLLLSSESYKILKKYQEKYNTTATSYIEYLITHQDSEFIKDCLNKKQELSQKISHIINFNKKLYLDLNATFSNINQIAYALNLAKLQQNQELENLINNAEFQQDVLKALGTNKEELLNLRTLLKHFLELLETHKKSYKNL